MISKTIFWTINLLLMTIAIAIAYVAGKRGSEIATLRQEAQSNGARTEADKRLCAVERTQAETRAAEAMKRATDAETREKTLRTQLSGWKTTSLKSGIVPWLQSHANCVGRGADGHCSSYKTPDGIVLETD